MEKGESNYSGNTKHYLNQVIKANIIRDESCVQHLHLIRCDENDTLSLWSSSPKLITQSSHEKNIRQIPRRTFIKYLTNILQAVKVIKNKESMKNCQSQEKHDDSKET